MKKSNKIQKDKMETGLELSTNQLITDISMEVDRSTQGIGTSLPRFN